MGWFSKQRKFRRISADRSRPVQERPQILVSPGKRAGRYVMTALFLVGSLVVINFPRPGPRLKIGDIAQRDYRARLQFEVDDIESTLRERGEAEARCPRIFIENTTHLERVPEMLEKFLLSLIEVPRATLLAKEGRGDWGLAPTQLTRLKQELNKKWIKEAIEAIRPPLKRAADLGIMSGATYQQEMSADRYDILVHGTETPEKTQIRQLGLTIEYPGELRRSFEEDLQSFLADKSRGFQEAFVDMLTHRAKPTLKLDAEATNRALTEAAKRVPMRKRAIHKDTIILPRGERVTAKTLNLIRREAEEFSALGILDRDREGAAERLSEQVRRGLGVSVLFLAAFGFLALYGAHFARRPLASNTRVFGIYTTTLVILAAARLLEEFGFWIHCTPVVLAAMVLTVICGPLLAFGVTALLAFFAGLVTDTGLALTIPLLAGGFAAIFGLVRLRRQTDLLEAGVIAGIAHGVIVWAVQLTEFRAGAGAIAWPVRESLAGLGGGVVAGFLLTGMLPYVERFFDVATNLRLFEWTDQNQPLLRKLAFEAPGTYHHSMVVGNIAESAAEEIGANVLLTRAGAYFHDVGKLNRPEFFIENTGGSAGRHEKLSPTLSTLILTAHTKDGVELALRYGVPSPLRRIIAEHHGTCVVEYFYDKALQEAGNPAGSLREDIFRYRGPKPHSPEAGIVMLADASESAARSLESASSSRIEHLVHEIVQKRIEDGQLDESRMNITDIRRVEKSLARNLMAISHPRIRYPGQ